MNSFTVFLFVINLISLFGVAVLSYRLTSMERNLRVASRIITGVTVKMMGQDSPSKTAVTDELFELANTDYSYLTKEN
jgi:hypothetical protein